MSNLLKVSEAGSLALHSMAFVAGRQKVVSVKEIAETLAISQNHLHKVCQRLAKAGLLRTTRGPHGGLALAKPANEISLLEIYELIERPIDDNYCLLGRKGCGHEFCILGAMIEKVSREVKEYLEITTLDKIALHG